VRGNDAMLEEVAAGRFGVGDDPSARRCSRQRGTAVKHGDTQPKCPQRLQEGHAMLPRCLQRLKWCRTRRRAAVSEARRRRGVALCGSSPALAVRRRKLGLVLDAGPLQRTRRAHMVRNGGRRLRSGKRWGGAGRLRPAGTRSGRTRSGRWLTNGYRVGVGHGPVLTGGLVLLHWVGPILWLKFAFQITPIA
jgi:hypothetical protein